MLIVLTSSKAILLKKEPNNCFDVLMSFSSFTYLEQEMENYIGGLIPNLAQLRDMPSAFVTMYCRIAAHKFFFFCDPHKRGWHLALVVRFLLNIDFVLYDRGIEHIN